MNRDGYRDQIVTRLRNVMWVCPASSRTVMAHAHSVMYTISVTRGVARVTVLGLSVIPSVRPPVLLLPSVRLLLSGTTRNKAAKKRYQRVQCHTG